MRRTHSVLADLRQAIAALARSLVQTFTSPTGRAILAAMFTGAAHLPQIAAARRQVFDDRLTRAEPVIARAIERGELPGTPTRPNCSRPLPRRSTCACSSPPSQSTRRPLTRRCGSRWPPRAPAHCGRHAPASRLPSRSSRKQPSSPR
ncbi:TetR-like C-terminal domain-containing protein [Micromonospora sp. NPDC049460]|uniref:TetR-like C-terminal domain-containing protein n=1 Tax=Micromonospora sp. NPDC049460 TaxID=3364272 RepID=UPI00379A1CB6